MKECIRIAMYIRLSKADNDGSRQESNSISMQRILIRKYIAGHFSDCQILEYQDDGFSGTNFNRPGVQKLLEDARNEKFDCIVVKDFSRFGRDYMEVGSYLEQIFPFLGIRFISINDHYDSANMQGKIADLDVNFKNLLYDLYSKDLSRKVKASLQAKKESGQYVSANAPFGYEKSPDDRHMLRICEDEAEIVRRIFLLALQGATSCQIAKKLNQECVPTPIEFQINKGRTSRKPKGDKFYWSSSSVCNILRNPVYAGDIQYGKTEKEQVGGCNVLKAREEWKSIKKHHAPIIAREDFEEAQRSRKKGHKKGKREENRHPLLGKAVCGCCKCNLRIKEGRELYFTCHNRYVTGLKECVSKVDARLLEQVVALRLEKYLEEQKLAVEAADRCRDDLKEKRTKLMRDMRCAKGECNRLRQKNYEGYQLYSSGEQVKFHSLRAEIEEKQKVVRELQEQVSHIDERLHMADSERFLTEGGAGMASEMIGRYIDKIMVYNEEEIEIEWKYH